MAMTSPFDEMERMFEEMQGMFEGMRRGRGSFGAGIALDVSRHDDEYLVVADLPGFEKEEIALTVDDGVLHIDAAHVVESEERSRSRTVHERVTLPGDVDADSDAFSASYRNGVLEIHLPASEGSEGHRIDIE